MNMRRILVIGCCGAGKSTLSLELGKRLALPVFHLDRLWWLPGWVERTVSEFDRELEILLEREEWIIDGNFNRTLDKRLEYADTVILLRYSRWRCLWRIFRRWLKYRGGVRGDVGEGCPERLNLEFLRFVWNFNRDMLPRTDALLREAGVKHLYVFGKPGETKRFLRELI